MAHFEVVVVGGGLVGATVSLALAQQGYSIALIDSAAPHPYETNSIPDVRVSAIGITATALLQRLAVWPALAKHDMTCYRTVQVWEHEAAQVQFSVEQLSLTQLGYIVENHLLRWALWQQLVTHPAVTLYCPNTLQYLTRTPAGWQLTLLEDQQLTAQLVVGADGADSQVRQQAGIGVTGWHYRQRCLLITVQCAQPTPDVTWLRFYPSGPRAYLPLKENWASLAWYDTPARSHELVTMPLPQLSNIIQCAYPACLGPIQARAAASFPLRRQQAQRYYLPGLVLLGDAAHTVHPLAGQGVNLGFRDVVALLQVLAQARQQGESIESEAVLMRYQQKRRADNLLMQSGIDILYKAFGAPQTPLPLLRNLALSAIQCSAPLKRLLLTYALGLF